MNLNGLASGVYRGNVSYSLSSAAVRTVNVTLVVEASAGTSDRTAKAVTCTPTQLVPTQTGLVDNFAQPAAWPTPLAILLVDNCGHPITNGQVVATFNNGDPPLVISVHRYNFRHVFGHVDTAAHLSGISPSLGQRRGFRFSRRDRPD